MLKRVKSLRFKSEYREILLLISLRLIEILDVIFVIAFNVSFFSLWETKNSN